MPPEAEEGRVYRLLRRAVDVRPAEVAALGWSLLYVFSVLSAYYVIRPIRDEMGVQGGVNNLQWLFTGTLLAMDTRRSLVPAAVTVLLPLLILAIVFDLPFSRHLLRRR